MAAESNAESALPVSSINLFTQSSTRPVRASVLAGRPVACIMTPTDSSAATALFPWLLPLPPLLLRRIFLAIEALLELPVLGGVSQKVKASTKPLLRAPGVDGNLSLEKEEMKRGNIAIIRLPSRRAPSPHLLGVCPTVRQAFSPTVPRPLAQTNHMRMVRGFGALAF